MSRLADYLALIKARPDLFKNLAHGGIKILTKEADIRDVEARMMAKGLPYELARVGFVYEDPYTCIVRDAVEFPDGKLLPDGTKDNRGTYIRMIDPREHRVAGVATLPVYQGQVLLIRIFRHALRGENLEIPRGFGEKGFSREENAHRELQEEIRATASSMVYLGQLYTNTGMSGTYDELFFAEVDSYGEVEIKEGIIAILPTPIPEFERMIRDNEITDGYTIAAYTRAKLHGLL